MRVVLADDHSIIRTALRQVIKDIDGGAEVVEASSFADLDQVLDGSGEDVDLLIVDLNMPGYQGPTHIRCIVKAVAPHPVVVFSMTEEPGEMRALLAEGVRAFIPKSTEHGVLGGIMRIVLAGGTYIPPVLGIGSKDAASTPAEAADGGLPPPIRSLTARQREVMELLAAGLSNNEICERMDLNLSTVKAHVSGVLRALGVESRTQAALRIRELMGRR